jgi:hypothetical protein
MATTDAADVPPMSATLNETHLALAQVNASFAQITHKLEEFSQTLDNTDLILDVWLSIWLRMNDKQSAIADPSCDVALHPVTPARPQSAAAAAATAATAAGAAAPRAALSTASTAPATAGHSAQMGTRGARPGAQAKKGVGSQPPARASKGPLTKKPA